MWKCYFSWSRPSLLDTSESKPKAGVYPPTPILIAGLLEYDGGEWVIEDSYGLQKVKLPAGDMVLYPSTSLHRVTPATA